MEKLTIEGTKKTPAVSFNPDNGELEINGRSIPENADSFYDPMIDWVKEYTSSTHPETTFKVKLEYYNSSSYKNLRDIFVLLEKFYAQGNNVSVNWYYESEDEDMQEAGEYYKEKMKLPIKLIVVDRLF